tara:strand:- start:4244 stop:5182 length:939 start_codon:yes stop_codon:yes gene_type:complete
MKKKIKKYYVGGAVNIAAGIGQGIIGLNQYRRGGREVAQADSLKAGMIRSEAARRRMAQQNTEAMAGLQSISRNMATASQALGRRGNRALIGGAASLTNAANRASQNYLTQYGASAAAKDKALERADFGESAMRINQDRARAQQLRDAGFKNMIGGAAKTVGGAVDAFAKSKDTENVKSLAEIKEAANSKAKMQEQINQTSKTQGEKIEEGLNDTMATASDKKGPNLLGLTRKLRKEEGMKKGGTIKKTPGKFSHKENPIDIVQKGSKIGEMTGGEYVFNPDQAKKLQSLSKEGNTPLHKFVNKMLNKSQFK